MRLVELNEEYIEAFIDADVIWYQEHLADDFVCPESDGFRSRYGPQRNDRDFLLGSLRPV